MDSRNRSVNACEPPNNSMQPSKGLRSCFPPGKGSVGEIGDRP